MKNLYEITTSNNQHLCYQVAKSGSMAVEFAKMYGHKKAAKATFIREC